MASNLYEFYTSQGQQLPSLQDRSQSYEKAGLGSASTYQGTAEQNTSLLNYLQQTPQVTQAAQTTAPTATTMAPANPNASIQQQIDAVAAQIPAIRAGVSKLSADQLGDPSAVGSAIKDAKDAIAPPTPPPAGTQDFITKGLLDLQNLVAQFQAPTLSQNESYVDTYTNLLKKEGLLDDNGKEGLKTQLTNLENVMMGTEEDITKELTAAGVPVTESGIKYLTGKRNEKLLQRASQLQNLINAKEDYIDKMVQLTGEDRKEAQQRLENQFNFKAQELQMRMQLYKAGVDAEQLNYQKQQDTFTRIKAMADMGAFADTSDERLKQIAKDSGGQFTFEDLKSIQKANEKGIETDVIGSENIGYYLINKNTGEVIKNIVGGVGKVGMAGKEFLLPNLGGDGSDMVFVPDSNLTATQKQKVNTVVAGTDLINQAEKLYREAVGTEYGGLGSGLLSRIKGVVRSGVKAFGYQVAPGASQLGLNQKWQAYQNFLDSNRAPIAKGIKGEVGNLAENEQINALKSFPNAYSSPYEADIAFSSIRSQAQSNIRTLGTLESMPSQESGEQTGTLSKEQYEELKKMGLVE